MKPTTTKPQPGRSPEEITQRQKEDAAKAKAAAQQAVVLAKPANTALAVPDNRTNAERWTDDLSPGFGVGRQMRFAKGGGFVFADSEEEVPEDAEFIVLADQTLAGFIHFSPPDQDGDREPPKRVMSLLYDKSFTAPQREDLGDCDPSNWPEGISGVAEDPWKKTQSIVLQNTQTQEMSTFSTVSKTGNRAVSDLLKHYNRTLRMGGNDYPVVRLRSSSYTDKRFGKIAIPLFVVVGKASPNSTAKPDTSPSGDMNDKLPW
jgi:hypothetical protein